jgi:ATP adenylyltransferase
LTSSDRNRKTKEKSETRRSETKSSKARPSAARPRNVLFRPDRMTYVRKLVPTKGCVFCSAAEAQMSLETLCIHKTKSSMILLNKFPYNPGHLLVLPRAHCGNLLKLSDSEYQDLHQTLRVALVAIEKIYLPAGVNLGMNHGEASGAGIPDHIHYHLVPRWVGDLNFFPLIAETKVVVETLEQTYTRFVEYFKTVGVSP